MKHLDRKDLGCLRERLIARETQLAGEIANAQHHVQEGVQGGRDLDPGQVDYDTAMALADIERDRREIEQVHAALGRMDRGTYGRCLSCGAGIPGERLRAEPSAELCQVCQARAEVS